MKRDRGADATGTLDRPRKCFGAWRFNDAYTRHLEVVVEGGYAPKTLCRKFIQGEPAYNDIGYHFGISADGTIYAGRPLDIKGSHTDKDNTGNIGIVLLDSYRGTDTLPDPMAESLKNLVQYLQIKYPDIQDNIDTHGERNQTVGNGKDTSEASEALPVIRELQEQGASAGHDAPPQDEEE